MTSGVSPASRDDVKRRACKHAQTYIRFSKHDIKDTYHGFSMCCTRMQTSNSTTRIAGLALSLTTWRSLADTASHPTAQQSRVKDSIRPQQQRRCIHGILARVSTAPPQRIHSPLYASGVSENIVAVQYKKKGRNRTKKMPCQRKSNARGEINNRYRDEPLI